MKTSKRSDATIQYSNNAKYKLRTVLCASAFYWFEWMLIGITFALVGVLKEFGFIYWQIFFVLWIGNTLLSWSVVFTNDRTGIDLTLMENIEKMFFALKQKNCFLRLASFFLGICWTIWNMFWTGPAQVFLLLRRNRWVQDNKVAVLIAVSALQMAVWTEVYSVGYDDIVPVLERFAQDILMYMRGIYE